MSRRYFEQMLDELELTNFPGYQRWYATPNPVCFALPDLHHDFRSSGRPNRYDFCTIDYLRQPYWMPQNFVFPNYEPFCFLRRNDKRNFHGKGFQFPREKRNQGEKRFYQNRQDDGNFRADRGKGSDYFSQYDRRYQSNWNRDAPSQHYQTSREERNSSRLSFKNSSIDLSAEDILFDQHLKNFKHVFESRNPSTESLAHKENEIPNGVNENGIRSDSSLSSQYCKTSDNDWKDQQIKTSKTQLSDGNSYSLSSDFSKSYEYWYSPEEQQQIIDTLKEVNLRHDRQLRRDVFATRGEQIYSDESFSSGNESRNEYLQKTTSSDDDDDGINILLSPDCVPPVLEEINEEDEELKTGYLEKPATDFLEEFQNIFTGSPEKKIINKLTKENLNKSLNIEDDDEQNAAERVITNEDMDAVKTCLNFDNVSEESLERFSQGDVSSPEKNPRKISLDESNISYSNSSDQKPLDIDPIESKLRDTLTENMKQHDELHCSNSAKTPKVSSENKNVVKCKECFGSMDNSNESPCNSRKLCARNEHTESVYTFPEPSCEISSKPLSQNQLKVDNSFKNAYTESRSALKKLISTKENERILPAKEFILENRITSYKTHSNKKYENFENTSENHLTPAAMKQAYSENKIKSKHSANIFEQHQDSVKRNAIANQIKVMGHYNSHKISSQLPGHHSNPKHPEENCLSLSEPFLPRQVNETIYKRISVSEIFSKIENSDKDLKDFLDKKYQNGSRIEPSRDLGSLSPTDHLKQILGIGKDNKDFKSDNVQKIGNFKTAELSGFSQSQCRALNHLKSPCSATDAVTEKYSTLESKTLTSPNNLCCSAAVNKEIRNESPRENHQTCDKLSFKEIHYSTFEKPKTACINESNEKNGKCVGDFHLKSSNADYNGYSKMSNCETYSKSNNTTLINFSMKQTGRNDESQMQNCPCINNGSMTPISDTKMTVQSNMMSHNMSEDLNEKSSILNYSSQSKSDREIHHVKYSKRREDSLQNVDPIAVDAQNVLGEKKETKDPSLSLKTNSDSHKSKRKLRNKKKKEKSSEGHNNQRLTLGSKPSTEDNKFSKEINNEREIPNFSCTPECKRLLGASEKENTDIKRDLICAGDTEHSISKSRCKTQKKCNNHRTFLEKNQDRHSEMKQKNYLDFAPEEANSAKDLCVKARECQAKSKTVSEQKKLFQSTSKSKCNEFPSNCEFSQKQEGNRERAKSWKTQIRHCNISDAELDIKSVSSNEMQCGKESKEKGPFTENRTSEKYYKVNSKERKKDFSSKKGHEISDENNTMKSKISQHGIEEHVNHKNGPELFNEKKFPDTLNTHKILKQFQSPLNKDSTEEHEINKTTKEKFPEVNDNIEKNSTSDFIKVHHPDHLISLCVNSVLSAVMKCKMEETFRNAENTASLTEKQKHGDNSYYGKRFKLDTKCQKDGMLSSFPCTKLTRDSEQKVSKKCDYAVAICKHLEENIPCCKHSDNSAANTNSYALGQIGKGNIVFLEKCPHKHRKNCKTKNDDSVFPTRKLVKRDVLENKCYIDRSKSLIVLLPLDVVNNSLQKRAILCNQFQLYSVPRFYVQIPLNDTLTQFNPIRFSTSLKTNRFLSHNTLGLKNLFQKLPFLLEALNTLSNLDMAWSRMNLKELLEYHDNSKCSLEVKSNEKKLRKKYVSDVLKCWDILCCYVSSMRYGDT